MTLFCAIVAARMSLTGRDATGWSLAAVSAAVFDFFVILAIVSPPP
jgi:hypothetical protein